MNSSSAAVLHRHDLGGVAFVEIDNPPLNLVDRRLVEELHALVEALEKDDSVRVLVLRSRNPDFFVNHFDLSGRSSGPPSTIAPGTLSPLSHLYVRLSQLPQVTIGEIRGRTRGAGGELALALDFRFASIERAVMGQPEAGVGLHPGSGGTQRLPELLGRARALEVMLSGDDYDATMAERYGWVNRALPDAELGAFVERLAVRIAGFPAIGLRNVKEMVNANSLPKHDLLLAENQRFLDSLRQPEVIERIRWLFAQGAQAPGAIEMGFGAAVAGFARSGG